MSKPAEATLDGRRSEVPGEWGIWFFILGDMVVFALFFGVFVHERSGQEELYNASRDTLNVTFGAVNTLLLLSGSLFVIKALQAIRGDAAVVAGRRWLIAAFGCGALFAVNKVVEYADKLGASHGPYANDFFMYFFVFTGIHFLHLVVGLGALAYMWWIAGRRQPLGARELRTMGSCAAYWHMVDLLWIVLFALLYLMS